MAKIPPSDFKVTTLENSLLSKQAVTSKGIPVSYTNLQLNPYPNTKLDLFCSDNLSFQCTTPSTWLTNSARILVRDLITNLRRMLATKFFNSSHSSFFKRKMNWVKFCLRSQFAWTRHCFTLLQLCKPLIGLKINPYICLGLDAKQNWKSIFHKSRQISYLLSWLSSFGLQ